MANDVYMLIYMAWYAIALDSLPSVRSIILMYVHVEDRGAANSNAIAMHQQIGIVDLSLIDTHSVGTTQISYVKTILAWNYLCMFARNRNVSEYDGTGLVASYCDALALFQRDSARGTRSNDDECRVLLKCSDDVRR